MGGRAEVGCHTGVRAWSAGPASARALLLLSAGPAPGPRPPPAPPHTAAGSGGASGLGARVGLAVCLSGGIGGQGLPT